MSIDLSDIFGERFFETDILQADRRRALETAHQHHQDLTGSRGAAFQVVVPEGADLAWLRDHLIRPLVYQAESSGRPLPECGDLFVCFIYGAHLSCVAAGRVIEWAASVLDTTPDELARSYGTGEVGTVVRSGPESAGS